MKHWVYIALMLLAVPTVCGQSISKISKQHFQIGEQAEVFYELQLSSESDKIRFEPEVGMIPCDPVSENSSLRSGDKVNMEIIRFEDSIAYGKPLKWVGKYTITAWDTGSFEIPAPSIVVNDSTVEFQSVRFKVGAPKLIEGQGIYETETKFIDLPEDPFYWLKQNWWWIALIAAAAIGFWIYLKFFRKREPIHEPKELSLKERTLMAIDALDAARLWEKEQLKEHYIEMSYILRAYLGVRYSLNLLERTSYQTTVLLIAQGLSQDTVQTIQTILDQSDMVKFAKSAPTEIEIYKISALAKQIVAETSPIEFDV